MSFMNQNTYKEEEINFLYFKLSNEGFAKEEIIKILEGRRYKNYQITSLSNKTKLTEFSQVLRKLYLFDYDTKTITTLEGVPVEDVIRDYLTKIVFDENIAAIEDRKRKDIDDIKARFNIR